MACEKTYEKLDMIKANPKDSESGTIDRLRRGSPYVILLLLVVVFLLQAYFFIRADTLIQYSDHHSFISSKYHDFFNGGEGTFFPKDWYPPVMYFITHLFYLVRGSSIETARLSLLVFVPVFIISMFGIGKRYGGTISGIVVAALAASSPFILNTSRNYFPDFPQTAMTALCFYLLLNTDEYRKTVMSYLLGLCLALSFLTKWSTPFFITFPLIWFILPHIFRSWRSGVTFLINLLFQGYIFYKMLVYKEISGPGIDPLLWFYYYVKNLAIPILIYLLVLFLVERMARRRKGREKGNEDVSGNDLIAPENTSAGWINTLNFSRMSATAMLLISPWLIYSALDIRYKFIFEHKTGDRSIGFNDFVFKYLLLMFKSHFNLSLVLICLGIVFLFIRREKLFEKLILPVNLIFCVALMSYIGHTDARYSLSLIIFTSTLAGYWVDYISKLRAYIAGLLISLSFLSIVAWMWFPQSPLFQGISRDRMSIIHASSTESSGFPLKILSGDTPHSFSAIDFSFIPLEMKKYGKNYMKIKAFDLVNFPGIYYPPPSLNDMLIDTALKHGMRPGPVGELPPPFSQYDKFIILYNKGDNFSGMENEIEESHREEKFIAVTREMEKGFFVKFILFYEKEEKYP